MSSTNREFYFPICIHFILFSCLIAMARDSSAMVNKSGKSTR